MRLAQEVRGSLAPVVIPMLRMSVQQFEDVVAEALGEIPPDLVERIDNVTVMVEGEPQHELLVELGMDPDEDLLFGLYEGVALPERGTNYAGALPDRILIYRLPLLRACKTRGELRREIRLTVIHELGHYFGLEEEELP